MTKETNNEAVIQVKDNQPTLLNDIQNIANTSVADQSYRSPVEKARNRIEVRNVEVFENIMFSDLKKWGLVKSVIKVERIRDVFDTKAKIWKHNEETSFYISTTVLEASKFCKVIREHWHIENKNHYPKDVSMAEDASRIRKNPGIMARLKSFSLNIMRANKVKNISTELYENSLDIERVLSYKGIRA